MGEFLLGLGWYLVRGRKIYHGPVMDMPVAVGESEVVGGDGVDEE